MSISLLVDEVCKSVIMAGTHLAPLMKVAEASKVIENAQRDINIAFVNELSKIFNCSIKQIHCSFYFIKHDNPIF